MCRKISGTGICSLLSCYDIILYVKGANFSEKDCPKRSGAIKTILKGKIMVLVIFVSESRVVNDGVSSATECDSKSTHKNVHQ